MLVGVLGQRRVGSLGLLQQRRALPSGVAQAADAEGGRQGARHAVAHRVGHRQVQDVAAEAVVEGVAADVRGRLQPRRQGERAAFAGERGRQQPPLDLGGQREGRAALPPLEQVGVPAVGDDHETEQVRRAGDLGQRVGTRLRRQGHLQQARGPHRARSPVRARSSAPCAPHRRTTVRAERAGAVGCAAPPRRDRRRGGARWRTRRRRAGHPRSRSPRRPGRWRA